MKSPLLFALPFVVLIGCVTPEDNTEILRLNQEKHRLEQQSRAKDSTLQAYIETINDIEESLVVIKDKEKIITVNSQDPEFGKSQGERIIDDINQISDLLDENKQRLAAVRQELKGAKLQIGNLEQELDRMIKRMTEQLEAKDGEIAALKEDLARANADFEILLAEYEAEVQQKQNLTTELNTAWYAMGSTRELKDNQVITKEGGIAGLGGTKKLDQNFNRDYFTQIDITKVKEISLSGKKAKLLTNHPEGSYELVGDEKAREKLVIADPAAFWSVSKYLVVLEE